MAKGERSDDDSEPLSEADRRALRGSRFASLHSLPTQSSASQPRLAHPGGPMKTNKAAALAKFLERKLQEPGGLSSINPDLLERAVANAKDTLKATSSRSGTTFGRVVQHVDSFGDPEHLHQDETESQDEKEETRKEKKKRKKHKKSKKKKSDRDTGTAEFARRKKKKLKM
ncbi:hypothetical protein H6P81_015070 [Aristolochia fimbriata]|uniref:Uncharacterized protein n=1 Tax=Aristolochia fimbriata TaxID=158543 RepID=A0AAV7E476_ARIFI|nr:hypothetical protein H6P81_015070 [Aristolochia fimbriata]